MRRLKWVMFPFFGFLVSGAFASFILWSVDYGSMSTLERCGIAFFAVMGTFAGLLANAFFLGDDDG